MASHKKLTPIHIRGKAGRKKAWQPPGPGKFKEKRRERAMKKMEARQSATQPAMSQLEGLPMEILMDIAVAAGNVNLLYSSTVFYRRLYNKSFLQELIRANFSSTWDLLWGRPRAIYWISYSQREAWVNDSDIPSQQVRGSLHASNGPPFT